MSVTESPEPARSPGAPAGGPPPARLPRIAAIAVLLLALVLLGYRLGAKDLWDASEGRPPESAREMTLRHDFLVQYTNGDVDLTKPPLYAWLTALSFAASGRETEWAARLPSVLATLAILLATFVLASRVRGRRAGVLAALLLVTQVRFLWQARLAELETLLALGVVLAYLAWAAALDAPPGRRRTIACLGFAAALGFAFAVKGPIAWLLVLPGALAAAVWTGRGRMLLSRSFLATLPVALLVGFPWYAAVVLRDPGAARVFLTYARGENVGHLRDPFYYLWQYPLAALPWTPLVLAGLALPFRRRVDPELARRLRLPFAGFAVTFLALSCLHAKQTHYLIPIFPLAAVLAAVWLDLALDRAVRPAGRGARVALAASAAVTAAAGVGIVLSPALFRDVPAWPGWTWTVPVGIAVLACGLLAVRGSLRGAPARAVVVLVLGVFVLELFGVGHAAPALNDTMSSRAFLERAAARVPADRPLASSIFGSHSDHLWYLHRTVTLATGEDLRAFLEGPGKRYALVFRREAEALSDVATVLDRDDHFQKKNRHVALVANAAGAGRP